MMCFRSSIMMKTQRISQHFCLYRPEKRSIKEKRWRVNGVCRDFNLKFNDHIFSKAVTGNLD